MSDSDKVHWLRHDDQFDDLVTEATHRSKGVFDLIKARKLDSNAVREFSFLVVEAALRRFADNATDLLDDGRYSDHIQEVLRQAGQGAASKEQVEMVRGVFRYIHAALKELFPADQAWVVMASVAPLVTTKVADLQLELFAITMRGTDAKEEDPDHSG